MKGKSKLLALGLAATLTFTTACSSGSGTDPFAFAFDSFVSGAKGATYVSGEELLYYSEINGLSNENRQKMTSAHLKQLDFAKFNYTVHLAQGDAIYYSKDAKDSKDNSFFGELYGYNLLTGQESKIFSMEDVWNDLPAKARQGITKGNFGMKPVVVKGDQILFFVYTDLESEFAEYLYSYNTDKKEVKKLHTFAIDRSLGLSIQRVEFEGKFYFTGAFAADKNGIVTKGQVCEYNFESGEVAVYAEDGFGPVVYDGKLYYRDYQRENEDTQKSLDEKGQKQQGESSGADTEDTKEKDVFCYLKTKDGETVFYAEKAADSVTVTPCGNTVLFEKEVSEGEYKQIQEQNGAIPKLPGNEQQNQVSKTAAAAKIPVVQVDNKEGTGEAVEGEEEGVEGFGDDTGDDTGNDNGGEPQEEEGQENNGDNSSFGGEHVIGVFQNGKFQPLLFTANSFNASFTVDAKTDGRFVTWDKHCSAPGETDLNLYDMKKGKFVSVGTVHVEYFATITTMVSDTHICFVVYLTDDKGEYSNISVYNVPKNAL